MTEKERKPACDTPETCKDDLMLGLFSLFDKIENASEESAKKNTDRESHE